MSGWVHTRLSASSSSLSCPSSSRVCADIAATLARREPLVEILLDRVEGSTGASEAHVPIRPHEVLRGIVHTEPFECLAAFIDQRAGLRAASEKPDAQQAVTSCRVPTEALDVEGLDIAA